MEELNVTWMYPDILNLHGDRGNIFAIERIGKLLGLKVNINRIDDYENMIDYKNTDILLFPAGEIKVMSQVIDSLQKQKDELEEYINSNKVVLAISRVNDNNS